jgi:hypothetical protein
MAAAKTRTPEDAEAEQRITLILEKTGADTFPEARRFLDALGKKLDADTIDNLDSFMPRETAVVFTPAIVHALIRHDTALRHHGNGSAKNMSLHARLDYENRRLVAEVLTPETLPSALGAALRNPDQRVLHRPIDLRLKSNFKLPMLLAGQLQPALGALDWGKGVKNVAAQLQKRGFVPLAPR